MAQNKIKMKNSISYKEYCNSVSSFFEFLKKNNSIYDLNVKALKVKKRNNFQLVPLSYLHLKDENIIKKLCEWRNKFSHTYYPNKKTTVFKTKIWIKKFVLKKKDKILFIVMKNGTIPVGHIGFANCFNAELNFEIDNVVKGEKNLHPNLFSDVIQTLMDWARSTFYLNDITLKVMHANKRAIKYYKRNNFKIFNDKNNKDKKIYLSMIHQKNSINNEFILTAGPSISQKEIFYVNDAVSNGWNNKSQDYIKLLEKKFAGYLNCKYAISTSSCTGAMQIALMALGIKKGDEVIVPNITWVATAKAVSYINATPVFADVNINDWTINTESLQKLITKKTKAIMPVHLYGQPSNMEEILKIAKKHKLYIVEDAAPAIGAEYKNKKCGTFGNFGAFSFQGAKLLVSGEGGMLVTNNKKLYKKALKISNHGRSEKKQFHIDGPGVKYKMSNIQAALAYGQLSRIEVLIALKRRIFSWYVKYLKNINSISLNYETEDTKSIFWMTSLVLLKKIKIKRETLSRKLYKNKIDTRPVFPELSSFKIWGVKKNNILYKNSKYLSKNALNLPSGVCLNENQIKFVCKNISSILEKSNRN